jgi:calcineurin-like phosphoesterase family protein
MSNIFFSGCTHFHHENIIKLANRPFSSVEEMDETLIDNWNKTVGKKDLVYHLGDFAFRNNTNDRDIFKRLNGTIVLMQGNHDPLLWGHKYYEFKQHKRLFVLCHYPFEEWNGYFKGAIHIHCHTHKPALISAERRFNVTVEATDYKPISLEEIMTYV